MSLPPSPFTSPPSRPGHGHIALSLLPPAKPVLSTFTYQYPLKLISPDTHTSPSGHPVSLIFLLTYGGGLVAGDNINLTITIAPSTRLALVTQGSTKIFKTPSRDIVSEQVLDVSVRKGAGLVYLPDPVQPFGESCYTQRQTFRVEGTEECGLCILDWVSEGRTARGEKWGLWNWRSRNEVREHVDHKDREDICFGNDGRLFLRDALILNDKGMSPAGGLGEKTDGMGVFGTLILHGQQFFALKQLFMHEFKNLPRIGAKKWASEETPEATVSESQAWSQQRQEREVADGLLWTAAELRGFVVVKFGAQAVEGARRWLREMLKREGTVEREFGPQALLCLG